MGLIKGPNGGAIVGPSGGGLSSSGVAAASSLPTTYTIENPEVADSNVYARFGHVFAEGDVPSGSVPTFTVQGGSEVTDIQFDERVTWADGSLKFCVVHMVDSDLATGSRTYDVDTKVGSYNNTGTFSTSDISSNSTLKVALESVGDWQRKYVFLSDAFDTTASDATVTVNFTSHGASVGDFVSFTGVSTIGGNLDVNDTLWEVATVPDVNTLTFEHTSTANSTASSQGGGNKIVWVHTPTTGNDFELDLNTALATATRITKVHSGPVCDGWVIWQYAEDTTTTTEDDHITGAWYVDIWNDGTDTVNGNIEFGCLLGQFFWDTTSKTQRCYNAVLKDNTTTIESYNNVKHFYHAGWFTCQKDTSKASLYGKRQWLTVANQPTLLMQPNVGYWVQTQLIPPIDPDYAPTENGREKDYVPMYSMGHRAGIDGTGAYPGRGVITAFDVDYLLTPTESRSQRMRVNGFSGWHVPYQYMSKDTRDRRNKVADDYNDFPNTDVGTDEAYTRISLNLGPIKPAGTYTFTTQGLPTYKHAYNNNNEINTVSASERGGYTDWTYNDNKGNPDIADWTVSGGASHGVSYSIGPYMIEGERYFYDAQAGLAMNLIHVTKGSSGEGQPQVLWDDAIFEPRPTDWSLSGTSRYAALGGFNMNNYRYAGWQAIISAYGWGFCPDNDVHKEYFDELIDQTGDYYTDSIVGLPTAMTDLGCMWQTLGSLTPGIGDDRGFFAYMNACNFQIAAVVSEDPGYSSAADIQANYIANLWNMGTFYPGFYNHNYNRKYGDLDDTDNPFFGSNDLYVAPQDDATVTGGGSANITVDQERGLNWAIGDKVIFSNCNDTSSSTSSTARTIPPEVTEGTTYYVVNPTGSTAIQVSATEGGSAITFASSATAALYQQCQNHPTVAANTSYNWMCYQAVIAAHHRGHAGSNQTLIDQVNTWCASFAPTNDDVTYSAKEFST